MKKQNKYKLLVIVIGICCFTQLGLAQTAPNISYATPQIYVVNSPVITLTPTNSGGTPAINGQTSTLAGSGTAGYTNGNGISASFHTPSGVAVDAAGNVYVGDYNNAVIRKITPAGVVTTLAGSGTAGYADGTGTSASFHYPTGLCVDQSGNVYVADQGNNMIRKITPAGVVTTLAGQTTAGYTNGTGNAAQFNRPFGTAVDASGNVYVADYNNNAIREVTPSGVVTTFAGSTTGAAGSTNSTGTSARFYFPTGLCIDGSGNLYIADAGNGGIRKITPGAVVTTYSSPSNFNLGIDVAVDGLGNVYVADKYAEQIKKINTSGTVTVLSGTGSQGATNSSGNAATYYWPINVAVDALGNLYVADQSNNLIRKVATTAFTVSPAPPAGISFNPATGVISGVPTAAASSANYAITAYNQYGGGNATLNMTVTLNAISPSTNQNYITVYTPRVSGITTNSGLLTASSDPTQVETTIQYIDGLGRPLQTVQAQASPTGKDVVQAYEYDSQSRDSVKYLPFTVSTSTPGAYQSGALTGTGGYTGGAQYQFYQQTGQGYVNTPYPYSGTNFEPSPLNRPVEDGAPGASWQLSTSGVSGSGHTVKMTYTLNNSTSFATDSVHGLQAAWYNVTINGDGSRTLVPEGYYPAGQLTVTITQDENWVSGRGGTIEEYKDNQGHVVLKRTYNYTNATSLQVLSTYYIYDDFNLLAFVLPPSSGADGGGTISQTTLNNLCYQYQYDDHGRMSGKKIPGKGWEYIVYNFIDQVVASQDANQAANNEWIFTKYDGVGRQIMTGIWNNGGTTISQTTLQGNLTALTSNLWEIPSNTTNGYSNVAWPSSNVTATLTLNYFDNYTGVPGLSSTPYSAPSLASVQTRGLTTAKMTAVLNTPTNMLWDVMFYDDLGRDIKTYAQHYLGGTLNNNNYDAIATTYNFTNQPTTITRQHWNTTSTTYPLVTITNTYIYDQVGRKVKTWEQITNGSNPPTAKTLISQVVYNEIGQLLNKNLHSTDSLNFLQTIAYTYNERGWLLTSSAPLFAMQLYYNTGSVYKEYNGNIMYQYWGTPGSLNNNYVYTYDNLNRLLSGTSTANNDESLTYDLMGNITTLNRYQANTLIDQLAYTYTNGSTATNQVQSIADGTSNNNGLVAGTTAYTYDANGNMLSGANSLNSGQNKTFTYNLLNLPQTAVVPTGTVTYTYDAAGTKLRKVSTVVNNNTDYISGIEYDGATAPSLSFIQTEEGKAVPTSTGGYDYTYYLGDNLGNTRITFDTKTGVAAVLQQDDYYPFGMEINSIVNSPKNEYLYNKKEKQEETQEYDYGARFYDPVIAKWTTADPFAENFENTSPYGYVLNNPIKLADVDGRDTGKVHNLQEVKITDTKPKQTFIYVPAPLVKVEPVPRIQLGPLGPTLGGLGLFLYLILSPENSMSDHSENDALEKMHKYRAMHAAAETVEKILEDAKFVRTTGTGIDIYEKDGGQKELDEDYKKVIDPTTDKPIPQTARTTVEGRMGKTPDGTIVLARASKEGRQTLDIQGAKKIEIRYNE